MQLGRANRQNGLARKKPKDLWYPQHSRSKGCCSRLAVHWHETGVSKHIKAKTGQNELGAIHWLPLPGPFVWVEVRKTGEAVDTNYNSSVTGPKQTQRPGGMQESNGDDGEIGTANQEEFCGSRGRDPLAPRRIEGYPAALIFLHTERYAFFFFGIPFRSVLPDQKLRS